MATDAERAAEQLSENRPVRWLARGGLVAYGLVHLLIAGLALRIAWRGQDRGNADPSGAMRAVAAQPGGAVLLCCLAAGLVGLALWQAGAAVWGVADAPAGRRLRDRVTSVARAIVYATLAGSAVSAAFGSGVSSSQSQQRATSGVLGLPGGRLIVVVVGVVVVAIGVGMVVRGVRESIGDEIDLSSMRPVTRSVAERLGQVGYIAKGVAFDLVGGLLGYAAVTFDRRKAQGLDGALELLLAQPLGRFLLSSVAIGFAAFGFYAMLQARYRRL
jgi:uncharacterized protein DUF1206